MHWADTIDDLDPEYERALAHMRRSVLAGLIVLGLLILALMGAAVVGILSGAGVL